MDIALTVRHLRLRLGLLLALLAGAVGPLLAQTPPNLNRVEFFLDTDPGHGLATAVTLPGPAAPTRLGLTFPVPLGSLAPGFHRLFIRSRDANNQWSQTFARLFFIDDNSALTAPNLAVAEHFLDTDPGFGNGSSTALTGTSVLNRTIPVNIGSLAPGFHRLFLRTRDVNNKWSQTFARLFFVDDNSALVAPNLAVAEHFLDTDPGFGNGISTTLTGTSVLGRTIPVNIGSLSPGFHRLFLRTRDANNKWSQTFARLFFVDDASAQVAPNLARAEFYFDTDPGFGSATAIATGAAAPSYTALPVAADASALPDGPHRLFVRVLDANGRWSQVLNRAFVRSGCAASENFAENQPAASYGGNLGAAAAEAVFNGRGEANFFNNNTVQADLGAATRTVSEAQVSLRNPNGTAVSGTLTLEVSLNGTTFSAAGSVPVALPASQAAPQRVVLPLPAAVAGVRAVRLLLTLPSLGQAIRMTDAGVYFFNCVSPVITSFAPPSGPVGTSVTITGTNLGGVTAVRFNGVAATVFSGVSATSVTATVPAGASTGPVSLTTANGTAVSSSNFTVTAPAPTIASFTPTSGPVGTSVTLTGTDLGTTSAVRFNGVNAPTFAVVNGTTVTATVPPGATTGVIGITTTSGTGSSAANFTVLLPPTVTSFTPTSGPVGTSVVVTGTSFTGTTAVTFNGTAASVFVVNSSTQITVTVPTGAATGVIGVTTPIGSGQSAGNFTVTVPAPAIASFTPASGPVGTGVTITGTNLTGTTVVAFNGTAAPGFVVNGTGTSLTVSVPTGATTGLISVTTPNGTGSSASNFTVTIPITPAPAIASFTPTSGPVGTSVVITGTNFGGATALTFNGLTAAFTVNSATSITATVPAGATTGLIGVTTPNGTGSSASNFTVTIPTTPAPTIVSFAPTSGPVGTSVVITGTNFGGATALTFNGLTAAFTVNSATSITATVPAGATTGLIGVTTPNGTGSSASNFTVTIPTTPAPTIVSFAPTSGPVGTSVVITGTNFGGATALTFNGLTAAFTVNSATSITATVPVGATTGSIGVTTPGGSASSSASFTVLAPLPTVTSFTPTSGPVGTSVVVTGTDFTGATAVRFNGVLAGGFAVNSATQITVSVPVAASTGPVRVTTPSGSGQSTSNFTVTAAAPVIVSFAPASGPVGTSVVLTGTDFSGATALTFNGLAASFAVNSGTQITATVPAGATTGVIGVTTPGGSASSASSFTVTTAPAVPTIATTVFGGTFCAGASFSVAFTASGFVGGNVFTAQLSDAGGLFAAPVSLGTLPGTGSGSIAATIPASTAAGSGYRVRVVGSSPATTGTDNGSNLTISAFGLTAWTGAAGTSSWFDANNWSCGQLPTAASDVTLPAGLPRYPVLPATGSVPAARNLTIATGASLTLGSGFALSGNLTNNGTFNAASSTFTLVGTAAQTLGGSGSTVLFDLTVNNPAGASLLAPLAVRRVLTLTAGNLASGGLLTLRSDASGTAMVVNPSGGGLITGPATMERFINNASGVGYRHYASPMQAGTATVQQFADDLPVFELNPAYNTAGNTVTPFPTFFAYDETRLNTLANDNFDQGWRVPLATDGLVPGRGYTAQTANTTLVDISGTLAHADVSLSLTRGAFANSGWQLLGNPFPSPLDWDLVPATPGVGRAAYVFVPSGPYSGTYRSYLPSAVPGQPGIGTNGGTKDLAAMQGFFVRATANGAAFTLPAAARSATYLNPGFARGSSGAGPLVRLNVTSAAGLTDETVIHFDPAASPGFGAAHDAHKVQLNGNGFPSLWSEASGPAGALSLSINGLPDVRQAPSIPLGVAVSQIGSFTLNAPELLNLPAGTEVWLEDQALGRRHNLSQAPSYAFQMAASFRGPRFVLWFQQRPTGTANAALAANLRLYPNPATSTATVELAGATGPVELTLTNVLGQVLLRRTATPRAGALRELLDLRELPTGVYLLHVGTATGYATQRLLRE